MRRAISRETMAQMTRPKPQLRNEAAAQVRKVRTTAWFGVFARLTSATMPRLIGGALASAWPATRIKIIWNAKVRILKIPAYQEVMMTSGLPFGASSHAARAVASVSAIAMTNGSGIQRSNRVTQKATNPRFGRSRRVSAMAVMRHLPLVPFRLEQAPVGLSRPGSTGRTAGTMPVA